MTSQLQQQEHSKPKTLGEIDSNLLNPKTPNERRSEETNSEDSSFADDDDAATATDTEDVAKFVDSGKKLLQQFHASLLSDGWYKLEKGPKKGKSSEKGKKFAGKNDDDDDGRGKRALIKYVEPKFGKQCHITFVP